MMAQSKVGASYKLIGRDQELRVIRACLDSNKNLLIEGPVGVGKTHLAISACNDLKRKFFRIDGDGRYSEQKMTGWFDPPLVMKKGFKKEAFIEGPLVQAMLEGGVLFINELNRLPEGVQNVLLPAIDEKFITVPRYGTVRAKEGFVVLATQNPKEFVATSHLSEAILDRFELIKLPYQSENEEADIVFQKTTQIKNIDRRLIAAAVRLVRTTRSHPKIRRGASVRAAISLVEITAALSHKGINARDAFFKAVTIALPTRIEVEQDVDPEKLLLDIAEEHYLESSTEKKKN